MMICCSCLPNGRIPVEKTVLIDTPQPLIRVVMENSLAGVPLSERVHLKDKHTINATRRN